MGLHLKHIHYGKTDLGDSKIVGMTFPYSLATITAWIPVIPYMGIAHADLALEVPMAGKGILITVGEAGSGKGTLVATVFNGFVKVNSTEEKTGDGNIHIHDIKLPAHGMHAYEVTVEARAGPPPVFRHEQPVSCIPPAMADGTEFPWIETIDKVDSRFTADTYLHTYVGSGGCIIQEIGFDRHFL